MNGHTGVCEIECTSLEDTEGEGVFFEIECACGVDFIGDALAIVGGEFSEDLLVVVGVKLELGGGLGVVGHILIIFSFLGNNSRFIEHWFHHGLEGFLLLRGWFGDNLLRSLGGETLNDCKPLH